MDELLEEGVTIANRKTEEGGFLFGGEQAKSEPFEAKKNADGKITEVNYRGSSEMSSSNSEAASPLRLPSPAKTPAPPARSAL